MGFCVTTNANDTTPLAMKNTRKGYLHAFSSLIFSDFTLKVADQGQVFWLFHTNHHFSPCTHSCSQADCSSVGFSLKRAQKYLEWVFSFWDVHCVGVVPTQQTGTYKQSWATVRRTRPGDGNAAYILEIKGRRGF